MRKEVKGKEKSPPKFKKEDEQQKEAKLKALSGIAFGIEARPDVPEFLGSPNEQVEPKDDLNQIYEAILSKKGIRVASEKDEDEEED